MRRVEEVNVTCIVVHLTAGISALTAKPLGRTHVGRGFQGYPLGRHRCDSIDGAQLKSGEQHTWSTTHNQVGSPSCDGDYVMAPPRPKRLSPGCWESI